MTRMMRRLRLTYLLALFEGRLLAAFARGTWIGFVKGTRAIWRSEN